MTLMTYRYKYYHDEKFCQNVACNGTYHIIACTNYKEIWDHLALNKQKENSLKYTRHQQGIYIVNNSYDQSIQWIG